MGNKIRIKMADLNIGKDGDILITSGLGSCVGVTLYDSKSQIGGMAHVMLPEFPENKDDGNPAKYADTALDMLIDKLKKAGASKRRFEAKMAGGAQMFKFSNSSDKMRIGARNIEAVKKYLKKSNIPIKGSEVGKDYGRTMEFDVGTGKATIKTVKKDDIIL
ncbi:chemotaxis protein CheD [Halanaerobacter jeridensis]|uniref:Probable chemoreceptor glutamine deamidase CheD n=1 Tax=Halanaerobacter jeridensis TaxID=706427 RepID=A0A938XTN7_9FIRM|nr:chemotaxis protein CheD [Halanaerobacter jeridensis]MBM7555362.1 chemotaxis protein CheD [Halanaerobacter jeridensis]